MKSLGKNAIFNIIYKCLNLLFPLVTAAYVSRILLPVGVGKVAASQNIVQYFVILAALGLPSYGVKKVAEFSQNEHKLSKVFIELFTINAIATIASSVIYILLICQIYEGQKLILGFVVGIQLFFNIVNIDWFYQGLEEYKYIMLRSLVVKLVSLASVLLFVRAEDDYIVYAGITSCSLVANYLFNVFNLRKYIRRIAVSELRVKQHIWSVLYLLAASIAVEVYTLADTTMLNLMRGEEIVGYYTSATKITSMLRTLVAAVSAVFLPRLSVLFSSGKIDEFKQLAINGLEIILSIAVPTAVGIFLVAGNCVMLLLGESFANSIITLRILSVSIITVALSNFIGYQILVTIGKEKIVLITTVIGAVINLVLNLFFINTLGHNGAAIASVITEGGIAIVQIIFMVKYIKIRINLQQVASVIIPSICMAVVVVVIKLFFDSIILELIFSIITGIIIYSLFAAMMRNKFAHMVLNKLKREIK